MKSLYTPVAFFVVSGAFAAGGLICNTHTDCDDGDACTKDRCVELGEFCPDGSLPDESDCCFTDLSPQFFHACYCSRDVGQPVVPVTDNITCTVDFCDDQGQPAHLPIPDCTDFQTRLLFVPADLAPVTVITNIPFEYAIDGGDSVRIEVFVLFDNFATNVYEVQLPCTIASDQPTSPAANVQQVRIDNGRSDFIFPFAEFPVADQGNCEATMCQEDSDCPGNSTCVDRACSIASPRIACTQLLGLRPAPTPQYLGDFRYEFPNDAKGNYIIQPICCIDDQNCDGMTDDSECEFARTSLGHSPIINFDIIDPLTVVIQEGDCLVGTTCTPNVTRFECEQQLGGTFRPDGNCICIDASECNDNNACTVDTCVDIGSLCPNGTKPDTNNCCNLNETPAGFCCDPTSGQIAFRSDADPCTTDTCDPTGHPIHTPIPDCDLNAPVPTLTTWGQVILIVAFIGGLAAAARRGLPRFN